MINWTIRRLQNGRFQSTDQRKHADAESAERLTFGVCGPPPPQQVPGGWIRHRIAKEALLTGLQPPASIIRVTSLTKTEKVSRRMGHDASVVIEPTSSDSREETRPAPSDFAFRREPLDNILALVHNYRA